MRHSRRHDFQGHPRSGSRSGDNLSPLSGLFFCDVYCVVALILWHFGLAPFSCSSSQLQQIWLTTACMLHTVDIPCSTNHFGCCHSTSCLCVLVVYNTVGRWVSVQLEVVCISNIRIFSRCATIIDFPNLGLTYNGGWCTATKLGETLISRPSCEVNVNRERFRCYGAVYLSSNQMLE